MAEYQARLFKVGDEEQIVDLLETAFDGWPRFDIPCSPLEHWRWKYLDNPIDPVLVFVAEKGGEIVGSSHLMPCLVNIGGYTVLGSNGADVCTHPEHRRKGVYSKILDFQEPIVLENDVLFWFGIDTNPILIKKNLQDGSDEVVPHRAALYVKIKDVDRHLRVTSQKYPFIKKIGYRVFEKMNRLGFNNSLTSNNTSFEIKITNHFEEEADILFEEFRGFFGYIIERNSEYLNWRYCDPRGGDYRIWSAFDEKRLLGFVVSRINRHDINYPTGHILDLIFKTSRLDVADALLKIALLDLDEKGVNVVYYLGITDNPLDTIVRRNGFVNSRERILWEYWGHSLMADYANVLKKLPSERVYFTYGDIDWI